MSTHERVPHFVNLEEGLPSVEEARARLRGAISNARRARLRVLTVIHGYGSTGLGGKLRWGIRRSLGKLFRKGLIGDFLPGEEFSEFEVRALEALSRYPFLWRDPNLNRGNKGITFVILDPEPLDPCLGQFVFQRLCQNSRCVIASARRVRGNPFIFNRP
jgi:hypothetical protein